MKKLGKSLLLLIVGSVVAWQLATPTYTYRYRLTVEVNTPEGVKSGSSVIQVSTTKIPRWLRGLFGTEDVEVKGEAVFVDLGNGKNVIAPLTNSFETLAPKVLLAEQLTAHESRPEMAKKLMRAQPSETLIPQKYTPILITFLNLSSPDSAQVIYAVTDDKKMDQDRFLAVFGSGYSFSNVRLALTSAPITYKIIDKLPWWDLPTRPAVKAWEKINYAAGLSGSIEPERLFIKD